MAYCYPVISVHKTNYANHWLVLFRINEELTIFHQHETLH